MTTQIPSGRGGWAKVATGIVGFDRMTFGGLPKGRISVVLGATGAGKTVFAMQTLLHRVEVEGVSGVVVSFEQSPQAIVADLVSFGWDVSGLVQHGQLQILDGRPNLEMVFTGAFDISGLLASISAIAAARPLACVVFDGLDALLSLLPGPTEQRQELLRLQTQAEAMQVTVVLTLKAKLDLENSFEELALYMADCVVELNRDIDENIASRSIRIQKYRGSPHILSRQPFLLTDHGFVIDGLERDMEPVEAPDERLTTGLPRLDDMLAGGLFRASTTLLSGAPGTAKTTLGSLFLSAMCERGETALFIGFDEAAEEAVRNVASVGIDLKRHLASGLLRMHRILNQAMGPDEISHEITRLIERYSPDHLLLDPVSIFSLAARSQNAIQRIVHFCKRRRITVVLTSLLDRGVGEVEATRSHISSICDTWIHLSYVINGGERNRGLTIIKSRGTPHSNQVGELLLSKDGITIADVYTEDGSVLMGSLRWQKERANQETIRREAEIAASHYRDVELATEDLMRRIAGLSDELEGKRREMDLIRSSTVRMEQIEAERRAKLQRLRGGKTEGGYEGMETE